MLSGGRVLSFHSALVSDTGRYTCVAVNAGGEQQREYDLRVYGESINIGSSVSARIVIPFYVCIGVCTPVGVCNECLLSRVLSQEYQKKVLSRIKPDLL